jgi:hypothetical protein
MAKFLMSTRVNLFRAFVATQQRVFRYWIVPAYLVVLSASNSPLASAAAGS